MADLTITVNTGATFSITVNPAPNVYATVSPGPSTQAIQDQLNSIVVEGDSSVEAAQARTDADSYTWTTLKERCDNDATKVRELSAGGLGASTAAGGRTTLEIYTRHYSSVTHLGFTLGSCTINQALSAMAANSILTCWAGSFTSGETPSTNGFVEIHKASSSNYAACFFHGQESDDYDYRQYSTGWSFSGTWKKYIIGSPVAIEDGGHGQTTASAGLSALGVRRGQSASFTAAATAYTDQAVTFGTAFGSGVTPIITITLLATGTAYATGGDVNWCIVTTSISNTGFTIRVWNKASSSFAAIFDYIAIAP